MEAIIIINAEIPSEIAAMEKNDDPILDKLTCAD